MSKPKSYKNRNHTDINFIMTGGVEFHPSQILLRKIRTNKIEGFSFGVFFTLLSIIISILTSNIYYLFLAIILFCVSLSSVALVYVHSELMFNQKYVINVFGLGLVRRSNVLYYYHSYDQLASSVIVHSVRGNLDYYSVLFLPVDLNIKLLGKADQISSERLKKLLRKARKFNRSVAKMKILERYFSFPYLDLELAIEIRQYYTKMLENRMSRTNI